MVFRGSGGADLRGGNSGNPWYIDVLNTRKPDHLKEGLLEFLHKGPKNLDECVIEGGEVLRRMGYKGPSNSDDFRMRVFEKLHQLKAIGYVSKDRSVKPPVFAVTKSAPNAA